MPDVEITRTQELAYELRVGDVMKREVVTVAPSTAMSDLRRILRENRISGTPVLDVDGRQIGSGKPGSLTKRLRDLYQAKAGREGEPLPF